MPSLVCAIHCKALPPQSPNQFGWHNCTRTASIRHGITQIQQISTFLSSHPSVHSWHDFKKQNTIRFIIVLRMFLPSCRIKSFFVLFRSSRVDAQGWYFLRVCWEDVFQTVPLCQLVVRSLRKSYWQCPCSFALSFGKRKSSAYLPQFVSE